MTKRHRYLSVSLSEITNINVIPHNAIISTYCTLDGKQEELCCLKSLHGTTKGKNITEAFVQHFEEQKYFVCNH